jgi:hypothetical protein
MKMIRDCDVEPDDTMVRIKHKRIYDPQLWADRWRNSSGPCPKCAGPMLRRKDHQYWRRCGPRYPASVGLMTTATGTMT